MDNLTHSFVGVLLAETSLLISGRGGRPGPRLRTEVYAAAVVGNNLPDLDFTYSRIGGPTFGYLLQHRGFTHTLPAALGFAVLTFAVASLLRRSRALSRAKPDRATLAAVALLGPLLHIAMDALNTYGVHPFWPIGERWYYGDTLFIVEPSLWVAMLAPLLGSMTSRAGRWTLGCAVGVAVVAPWCVPFVAWREAAALTLIAVALLAGTRKTTAVRRCVTANACAVGTILVFLGGSRATEALARAEMERALPAARTLDVALTPMPVTPFCWNVLWVGLDGDDYVVRVGQAAPLPFWLDVARCPFDRGVEATASLRGLAGVGTNRLRFRAEYRRPARDFRALAATRCEVAALLRFARVPYVTDPFAGGSRIAGDLRYDRRPGLDFADVRLPPREGPCPPHVPPWRPPRSDLLQSGATVPPTEPW